MKKNILKGLGIALAAVMTFGIVSCSNEVENPEQTLPVTKHTHQLGTKHEAVAATCKKNGSVEWYECLTSTCTEKLDKDGKVLASIVTDINPDNHTRKTTWTNTATTHKETYNCCQAEKTPESAHTWDHEDFQLDSVKGVEIRTCTICGYGEHKNHVHGSEITWITTETKHTETFNCCGAVKTAEADHDEDSGTVTTAPTCVTKGEKTFKCSVCDRVLRTEEIPELYSSPVDVATGNAATADSTYVYFGAFPNTVLPSTSTVTVDETETVTMGANTYYKGSDGEYYAKVLENAFGPSTSTAEYKYTDKTEVAQSSAGSYRYFKVEPIKWKVLTKKYDIDGKAGSETGCLLMADEVLTANVLYYVDKNNRTIGEKTIYANNYMYSTIRAYLNGKYEADDTQSKTAYDNKGFLQTAFTGTAQSKINDTVVNNSAETTWFSTKTYVRTYECENTTDKIFLLSAKEVINSDYGFDTDPLSSSEDNARVRKTTDFAKANHAKLYTLTNCLGGFWRLRSPACYYDADYSGYAVSVRNGGALLDGSKVDEAEISAIVPALTISF